MSFLSFSFSFSSRLLSSLCTVPWLIEVLHCVCYIVGYILVYRTQKKFRFAEKNNCPFYFVSAADGTNVVKVFTEVIKLGHHYKNNTDNFMDAVMELLAEQRLDD